MKETLRKRHILHMQSITCRRSAEEVVKSTCGLQAQFFNNPKHALKIRSLTKDTDWTKDMCKTWTIRYTLHMIHKDDLPLFIAINEKQMDYFQRWFEKDEEITLCARIMELIENGISDRKRIRSILVSEGLDTNKADVATDGWGGLCMSLCRQGKLIFKDITARDFKAIEPLPSMNYTEAWNTLVQRYFHTYGPCTIKDGAYFFKCPQKDIKKVVDHISLSSYEHLGKTFYYEEINKIPKYIPKIIFLAGFDPLMLGYHKEQNPFLPKNYIRGIFNLNGIVFPALLYKGSVIGRWKKEHKNLCITMFKEVDIDVQKQIEVFSKHCFKDDNLKISWKEEFYD